MIVLGFFQSIPISEFVSALLGGGLALAGTIYSLRYQQSQRNKRLRRALISEINSIEAGQIHLAASMLRTDEDDGLDFLDYFVEDQFDELTDGLIGQLDDDVREELLGVEQLKKESMKEAGGMITSVNLATPIWDSNTDKVGNLETNEIEKVIRFYRLLGVCKQHANDAVEAVEQEVEPDDGSDGTGSFDGYMWKLQNNARSLAELKKEALEALDADEFIEIQDSYLIHTEDGDYEADDGEPD
ncbi:hypothetical protein [Haloarcula hispanica]|uniref:hypothetical protein n=1 Tax=Haloarcula hispanica TaxID=51589 RepID=UPI0011B41962|nr:hypothetical protein [Haloarcula hispanica]